MDDLTRAWRFIEEAQEQLATANSQQLKRYWAYTLSNAEQQMDVLAMQMLEDSAND
jgi:hypothetical protein